MASTARAFVLKARAKFNLCLEIGAPTAGGLHSIRSVVADLLVCDEVAFLPSDRGFAVSCDDPTIPERANLARLAADALGVDLPEIAIQLRKGLPAQAGLGGGSADAAAALLGITAVLGKAGVTVSREALVAAAARVGSDVPACLVRGVKIVEGTGDIVHLVPVESLPWGVLLLKPAVGVSTADAYRLLDQKRASGAPRTSDPDLAIREMCGALVRRDFGRACALLHNDFQPIVEEAYPAVAQARRRVEAAGAEAAILCGSGACVAGIFEHARDAERALTSVRPGPGEWVAATGFADAE